MPSVAAETTTWKIQTSWPGGIRLEVFKDWCNGIAEKTGGELAFTPFGAKDVVGEFQLFDAVKNGVLDAMNPFTLYWAGRMPVAVFLSSYPLGPRNPHEWDTFYYGLGGLELAREAFGKMGLYFVGPIHHGPNIIHSKVPIRSIDDFRGRKMRLPGGMVAELFLFGDSAMLNILPSRIFPLMTNYQLPTTSYRRYPCSSSWPRCWKGRVSSKSSTTWSTRSWADCVAVWRSPRSSPPRCWRPCAGLSAPPR
jgi:hypothetical protein